MQSRSEYRKKAREMVGYGGLYAPITGVALVLVLSSSGRPTKADAAILASGIRSIVASGLSHPDIANVLGIPATNPDDDDVPPSPSDDVVVGEAARLTIAQAIAERKKRRKAAASSSLRRRIAKMDPKAWEELKTTSSRDVQEAYVMRPDILEHDMELANRGDKEAMARMAIGIGPRLARRSAARYGILNEADVADILAEATADLFAKRDSILRELKKEASRYESMRQAFAAFIGQGAARAAQRRARATEGQEAIRRAYRISESSLRGADLRQAAHVASVRSSFLGDPNRIISMIASALGRLPEEDRRTLAVYAASGEDIEQAAAYLGKTPDNLRKKIERITNRAALLTAALAADEVEKALGEKKERLIAAGEALAEAAEERARTIEAALSEGRDIEQALRERDIAKERAERIESALEAAGGEKAIEEASAAELARRLRAITEMPKEENIEEDVDEFFASLKSKGRPSKNPGRRPRSAANRQGRRRSLLRLLRG